jgi:DNA-binding GntR family transcriptional regulator
MTRREEVLHAIRGFVKANGYSPTIRDLAAILGVGHSTIQRALEDLVNDGKIQRANGVSRGMVVKGE